MDENEIQTDVMPKWIKVRVYYMADTDNYIVEAENTFTGMRCHATVSSLVAEKPDIGVLKMMRRNLMEQIS